jgi:hypothetical protein
MEVFALTLLVPMLGVPWVWVALTVVVEIETAIEVIIMAAITIAAFPFTLISPLFLRAILFIDTYLRVLSVVNPPTSLKGI